MSEKVVRFKERRYEELKLFISHFHLWTIGQRALKTAKFWTKINQQLSYANMECEACEWQTF